MAVFTADNGQLESVNSNAVSVAVSPDGDWLCIKQSDGVTRLDAEGEISWTSRVDLGTVPSAPAIGQDDVHVASSAGVLASLNGEDGKIYRRFRLTPGHWVLAAPSVADGVIYQESPRAGVARRGEMCHNTPSLHYSHTLAGQSTRINP